MLFLASAIALVCLVAAGTGFARWVSETSDEDREDTLWVDVREWLFLDRLFGPKIPRLTDGRTGEDRSRN
jgi:hypothetical protein